MTLELNLQRGLVGHWTMDDADTSGGILFDKSAHDNHGVLNNSVATGTSSPLGESHDFDPSNGSYTETSFSDALNISGPFSMAGWIYLDNDPDVDSNNNYREICSPGASHNPYGILLEDKRKITFNAYVNGGKRNFISGSTTIPVGSWSHISYWFDPNTGDARTFYNGLPEGTNSYTSGTLDSNSSPIRFSNTGGTGSSGTFPGRMSDWRIYDRKLSDPEVRALYNMRSQRNANI